MGDREREHERRIAELELKVAFLMRRLGVEGEYAASGRSIDAEVEQLVRAGRKIEAIKVWRESTGDGLKEAKDAVEAIQKRLR